MNRRRVLMLAALLTFQLILVAGAVYPQLSARAVGEEIRLRVEPIDPIDPFRGAYTQLDYPGLELETRRRVEGEVYLLLEQLPDGTWGSTAMVTERPDEGPYLACEGGWRLSCGIESWFTSDDEARRLEDALAAGTGIATVRIDSRGHAVLVDLDAG